MCGSQTDDSFEQFAQPLGGGNPTGKHDEVAVRFDAELDPGSLAFGEMEDRGVASVQDCAGTIRGCAQADRLFTQVAAHGEYEGRLAKSLAGQPTADRICHAVEVGPDGAENYGNSQVSSG